MLTDNLLIIPNGKLAESNIINYSMPKQDLSIWIPCGVAYESDLKKVERVSLEVAKQIQATVPGAVFAIRLHTIHPSGRADGGLS